MPNGHSNEADKFDRLRHKAFMPIRQDPLKTRQHFLEDREESVARLGDYVADIWRLEGFNRFL